MAKIYESRDDFERDKLKEQAAQQKYNALWHTANASGFIGLGAALHLLNAKKPRDWITWVGFASIGAGVFEMIKSWFTSSKAHTLELQRDRLGPETIVLPPDMAPPQGGEKRYLQSVQPTTLLEQADKSCGCPLAKR